MCLVCIGTAFWLLSGAGSAGGLAGALTLRSVRQRKTAVQRSNTRQIQPNASTQETAECDTAGRGATASPITHPT
jgi:hypothetical protein